MRVLYLGATGAGDPTKASLPLHIAANASVEAGQDCAVVLVGDATELALQATAEQVKESACRRRASCSRSSSSTRFRSTSERPAPSPVGDRRRPDLDERAWRPRPTSRRWPRTSTGSSAS